jgi:hypothetical protein
MNLAGKMGRRDQSMDVLLVLGAQLKGLGLERVAQHPTAGDGGIEDVLHVSSSSRNRALIVSVSISPKSPP